jgi:iron complex transport system ATP-binding protein
LSCHIGQKALLSGVNLEVADGEFLVVIGRNGAGKSTLLKHATGEMKSPDGEIEIFGQSLHAHPARELARKRAVLAQSTPLNFDYQVLEVVLLGRIPHQHRQIETSQDVEIALSCLARVGLQGYETRNYLTLSGGEQQRTHLARVLAQIEIGADEAPLSQRLLFLDEPISSLDIAHQHEVLDLAKKLTGEGVGVFAILHDLNLAAQYADRIVVLSEGAVIANGSPAEVLTQPILLQAFHHCVMVTQHPCLDCPLIISGNRPSHHSL